MQGDHTVVHAHQNVAVVQKPGIGQMFQPVQGFAVAQADGFPPRVGRGHDQHRRQGAAFGQSVKKHGVQGRVGQHDAHLARIGGHLWRQPRGAALGRFRQVARAENHGFFRALQQGLVFGSKGTEGAGRGKVAHHEGQGLVGPCFAPPQLLQALCVARVAGQLKTPQTLEGQNFSFKQGLYCPLKGMVHGVGSGRAMRCAGRRIHKPQARAARGAGNGLGVKAPVGGVGIFCGALRAERKAAHGGDSAVVGNGARDGVARAAVGAVGEGVVVARIGRIVHVGQAVGAHAHVGAHKHAVPGLARAGNDAEARFAFYRGQVVFHHAGEAGQRRQLCPQAAAKALYFFIRALQLHAHAFRGVAHSAGKPALGGKPIDKGAKTHALHLPRGHKGPSDR